MEENNIINNDNNINIDTSQTILQETNVSNNDTLFKSTDNGGLTTQSNDNYKPVLLILGDSTEIPTDDEEPVLLEDDDDIQYEAVINSDYESNDNVPTIILSSDEQSYSNANYVIAVTESNKNEPKIFDSNNLDVSYTNNENNWCNVTFKNPLNFTFTTPNLTLNSTNFPSNSNIIVPVITCQKNTGVSRSTKITFNIKNYGIEHNISLNVTQKTGTSYVTYSPCILKYESGYDSTDSSKENIKYKILTQKIYYYTYNHPTSVYTPCIFENEDDMYAENIWYNYLCFGIIDSNGNIDNNLPFDHNDLNEFSNKLKTTPETSYKLGLTYNAEIYKPGTAAVMYIIVPANGDNTDDITVSYNDNPFITIKYVHMPLYTIIARADWSYTNIYYTTYLYFLTNNNPKNGIPYKYYNISNQTLYNIIFLIENKYKIFTQEKTLQEVLTTYNMKHNSGYSFDSYMDYNVIDISDCICDVDGNSVDLKDIENGDSFTNFKIYIYTQNNQNEYIYLGYISMGEIYASGGLFIGFFDKNS